MQMANRSSWDLVFQHASAFEQCLHSSFSFNFNTWWGIRSLYSLNFHRSTRDRFAAFTEESDPRSSTWTEFSLSISQKYSISQFYKKDLALMIVFLQKDVEKSKFCWLENGNGGKSTRRLDYPPRLENIDDGINLICIPPGALCRSPDDDGRMYLIFCCNICTSGNSNLRTHPFSPSSKTEELILNIVQRVEFGKHFTQTHVPRPQCKTEDVEFQFFERPALEFHAWTDFSMTDQYPILYSWGKLQGYF